MNTHECRHDASSVVVYVSRPDGAAHGLEDVRLPAHAARRVAAHAAGAAQDNDHAAVTTTAVGAALRRAACEQHEAGVEHLPQLARVPEVPVQSGGGAVERHLPREHGRPEGLAAVRVLVHLTSACHGHAVRETTYVRCEQPIKSALCCMWAPARH